MDFYNEFRSIARYPFLQTNSTTSGEIKVVNLRRFGEVGYSDFGVLKIENCCVKFGSNELCEVTVVVVPMVQLVVVVEEKEGG